MEDYVSDFVIPLIIYTSLVFCAFMLGILMAIVYEKIRRMN